MRGKKTVEQLQEELNNLLFNNSQMLESDLKEISSVMEKIFKLQDGEENEGYARGD